MLMHDGFDLLCKSSTILQTDRIVLSCLYIWDYCYMRVGYPILIKVHAA